MNRAEKKEILNKIRLKMKEEFISKINQYGVNKFSRNGIQNPDVIYQIKKYDETLGFETVEEYLNAVDDFIDKLIERNEK